jgi:hypothetical protein
MEAGVKAQLIVFVPDFESAKPFLDKCVAYEHTQVPLGFTLTLFNCQNLVISEAPDRYGVLQSRLYALKMQQYIPSEGQNSLKQYFEMYPGLLTLEKLGS